MVPRSPSASAEKFVFCNAPFSSFHFHRSFRARPRVSEEEERVQRPSGAAAKDVSYLSHRRHRGSANQRPRLLRNCVLLKGDQKKEPQRLHFLCSGGPKTTIAEGGSKKCVTGTHALSRLNFSSTNHCLAPRRLPLPRRESPTQLLYKRRERRSLAMTSSIRHFVERDITVLLQRR